MSRSNANRERSDLPTPERTSFLLRLLSTQYKRIAVAADAIGKSMTDIIRDAVMIHVVEIEEAIEMAKKNEKNVNGKAFVPQGLYKSRGLGLKEYRNGTSVASPLPSSVPATIVIQNTTPPTTPSGPPDLITHLAGYILAGGESGPFEREQRARRAKEMIQATVRDPAEVEAFGKALADKIRALENEKKSTSAPSSSAWSWLNGLK